jgi:hypothetical protein
MQISSTTILLLLLLSAIPQKAFATDLQIAFLEDACEEGHDNSYNTRVRLAFLWQDSMWKSFDHNVRNFEELEHAATKFAGTHQWFLVDHENSIGTLISKGVDKYKWYKDVGMQELISELPATAKNPRDLKYSGWPGCPVRKPIVLSTALPIKDKESWRKVKADVRPSKKMAEQIRNSNNDLYAAADEKPVKASFTEKDLIVSEQYNSPIKGNLVALQFRKNAGVMNNTGDPDSSLYWFYLGNKTPSMLIGRGLVLIDWADYNSDGQTEFLFWVDGYNLNGYLISWSNFTKTDSFTWNYH